MGVFSRYFRKLRTARNFPKQLSLLFWTTVLFTISVLLAIVGTLQYQWSTEIKKESEVRVGADLESTMMKWHLDFYSEISAVCTALQIGPDSGARDSWEDYLQRYTQWSRAANSNDSTENIYTNPELVKDVYIWETSARARPRLLRLDPKTETIERSEIPLDLLALLAHLKRRASSLRVALHAWEPDDVPYEHPPAGKRFVLSHVLRGDAVAGWQFDEGTPAVVHPILRHSRGESWPAKVVSIDAPVDWVVAVLNLETIQKHILPRLARRYFRGSQDLKYKAAVITGGSTPRLLYSTDSDFVARDIRASDAVMNIFGSSPNVSGGQAWGVEVARESLKPEERLRFSGPVWFPVIQHTSKEGAWLLVLQSRNGSLDASVTRVWHSHLLTSGVVLLLLAASIVLVVVSSRRAEALANLQMDFVTSVSHELRTPLAAILSAGQNLTDGFATDLKLYGWLITTQARQEIDLVDQILLFASTKKGAKNYVLQPLAVTEVLDQVRRDSVTIFEQSGFTVDFQIAPSLPPVVGDSRLLSRCLQNLIGNAAKYSGRSRWIGVSAELEELGNSSSGVRISVADHGVGICSSELPQIFEPFYRSPSVLVAHIHGTGLGLSVTKHLAEAMGATVSVKSEPDVGSVFSLHFQAATELDSEMVA